MKNSSRASLAEIHLKKRETDREKGSFRYVIYIIFAFCIPFPPIIFFRSRMMVGSHNEASIFCKKLAKKMVFCLFVFLNVCLLFLSYFNFNFFHCVVTVRFFSSLVSNLSPEMLSSFLLTPPLQPESERHSWCGFAERPLPWYLLRRSFTDYVIAFVSFLNSSPLRKCIFQSFIMVHETQVTPPKKM